MLSYGIYIKEGNFIVNSLYLSHSLFITAITTPIVIAYITIVPILIFAIKMELPFKLLIFAVFIMFTAPLNSFVINMYNTMHTDKLTNDGYVIIKIFNIFQNKEIPSDRTMCSNQGDYVLLDSRFRKTSNLYDAYMIVCKATTTTLSPR